MNDIDFFSLPFENEIGRGFTGSLQGRASDKGRSNESAKCFADQRRQLGIGSLPSGISFVFGGVGRSWKVSGRHFASSRLGGPVLATIQGKGF